MAESHPSWWTYASPEATALVGIHWDTLRLSPFAPAIASELADGGSLRFPDLACLHDAQQLIISSPALLAMVVGRFPAALLQEQATRVAMKPAMYRGVPIWIHPAKDTLSVAVISDQLLLVASRRSLEGAIDRSDLGASEGARPANRRYSPLLARAARFAQNTDLWVVSTHLPDPLASLFVPIESEAGNFEGSLSLRDGLHVEAVMEAGSAGEAAGLSGDLRKSIPSLPAIARKLQVTTANSSVILALDVPSAILAAGLRDSAPVPVGSSTAPAPAVAVAARSQAVPIESPKPADPPKPEAPQVIRIVGLDEGPREIVLPPVKKQQ